MVRSLVDEVVRRRLWPIPLLALLVAIAAPLMFMKSAPEGASTEAPPAAAPVELPRPAGNLLDPRDRSAVSTKRSTRKAEDPFEPPASSAKADSAGASAAAPGASAAAASVPVVIKNSDGSTSTATISPSTGSSSKTTTSKSSTTKAKSRVGTTKATTSSAAAIKRVAYVDVRFGARMGTMIRYRVPQLQTFRADGKVAAMFIGYSATRNAAVFAIAPSTRVSGVTCRKVKGVCRYVDLPARAHARLTMLGQDGSPVSRRLDVVSIRHLPKAPASKASVRITTVTAARCLVKRLLGLSALAPSISVDACD